MIRLLTFLILITMCSCRPIARTEDAFDQAKRFALQGKFGKALEKHIWFHNHALEDGSAYDGGRLSFALADWVELGKKYPPALKALRKIRDEETSHLLAGHGNKHLFADVQLINTYLDEDEATVHLFKRIEATQPDFAASLLDIVMNTGSGSRS